MISYTSNDGVEVKFVFVKEMTSFQHYANETAFVLVLFAVGNGTDITFYIEVYTFHEFATKIEGAHLIVKSNDLSNFIIHDWSRHNDNDKIHRLF
ncbi:hypothetical protein DGG96_17385 [Legionella qingyii]|uniref:Uncharacterized protein n=1 Tax=Legionella qingyii TaxID=2184757 RepID=A0A317TY34_9GAMM|nr:hypothetical protein DGG96_17385 [Legionella qingyii]